MARKKPDMTEGPILSRLILFALPIMATTVLQLLFNTADTIVVGRWGGSTPEECEIALSAVGSCGALNTLLINFFMGFSVGAGVLTSHAIGAKQYDRVKSVVHTAILTAAICGALISVIGFVFAPTFLRWMSTPEEIMDQAVLYMRAYFCGITGNMIYSYCAAMLRSTGDSTRPLIFLSVAGVVNVGLNLIMVLGFHAGALGVGVATAASHWVSCIAILVYMKHTKGLCRFEWKSLRIHFPTLGKLLGIGVPTGIQSSMYSIGNTLMQASLNTLGSTVYISGSSIASNLGAYTQQPVESICQATLVFVGQNVGAKNIKRVRKCVLLSLLSVTVLGILANTVLNLVGEPLLAIYAPGNTEVVEFARLKMLVVSSAYFIGHLSAVLTMSLRGLGKATHSTIASIVGICGVRILWVYTVFALFPNPLVLFCAYGVSWLVTAIAQAILFYIEQRKIAKKWEEEALTEKILPV